MVSRSISSPMEPPTRIRMRDIRSRCRIRRDSRITTPHRDRPPMAMRPSTGPCPRGRHPRCRRFRRRTCLPERPRSSSPRRKRQGARPQRKRSSASRRSAGQDSSAFTSPREPWRRDFAETAESGLRRAAPSRNGSAQDRKQAGRCAMQSAGMRSMSRGTSLTPCSTLT